MDGKLLILCDELPGKHNNGDKEYKIQDYGFLVSEKLYNDDLESDKIFMTWEALIPEDRWFIEACKYYARFTEKPIPTFPIQKRGLTDPATGTLKDSLQERAYYDTYQAILQQLSEMNKNGEDWQAMALEYTVQYTFDANQTFFNELSRRLNNNEIVRILPCFSNNAEPNISRYRAEMLNAWNEQNNLRKKQEVTRAATAELLPFETYSDFSEILYVKSTNELMKIYSMSIFSEDNSKTDYDKRLIKN